MPDVLLITGAGGMIGTELVNYLGQGGRLVVALVTHDPSRYPQFENVKYVKCDIFNSDEICRVMEKYKPTGLIHLAWRSTGQFESNENFEFVSASVNLVKLFIRFGGRRLVFAGTYAEYASSEDKLVEAESEIRPLTVYAKCKNWTSQILACMSASSGISYACAKIFSVYGKESDARRLTAQVVNSLLSGKELLIRSGYLTRDYIYVKDVARALLALYDSDVVGDINICSGQGTLLRDYVNMIVDELRIYGLIRFVDTPSKQALRIVGSNERLVNQVGFRYGYDLRSGIHDMLVTKSKS